MAQRDVSRAPRSFLGGLLVTGCLLATVPLAPARAGAPGDYAPPVEAAVADPFRAPEHPYGPGNRGLKYDTVPGTEVVAAGDGVVVFAGSVAGSRHVTVRHADGLRTSYSFLDAVAVVVGQQVVQGQVVGTTVAQLHFGVRSGDAYFDPARLFGGDRATVRLVPFDEPPGSGSSGERSAVRQLIGGLGGALGDLAGLAGRAVGTTADWLRDDGSQLLRTGLHYGNRFLPGNAQVDLGLRLMLSHQDARRRSDRPCSTPAVSAGPPAERRMVVLVAGLGSNSEHATVDDIATDRLGYDAVDVARFSYAGGRTPAAAGGALDAIPVQAYGPHDTQVDLRVVGARLADLVEAMAAAAPGVPIDVFAHSQGGVVARLALIELERRHGPRGLEQLGVVATLGTPHGGADLATAVHAVSSTQSGGLALEALGSAAGMDLQHDGAAVAQLSETSDLMVELARHPVPPTVRGVSIAARGDLVVPGPRSSAAGMVDVVVPLVGPDAHSDLPGSPEVHRELSLALAGLPPGCQGFRDALLDAGMGELISYGQDLVGALGWMVAVRSDVR